MKLSKPKYVMPISLTVSEGAALQRLKDRYHSTAVGVIRKLILDADAFNQLPQPKGKKT